jgi:hypothetical protein
VRRITLTFRTRGQSPGVRLVKARMLTQRQYNYPVTPVRTELLATADLSRFSVIILPEAGPGAGYSGVFGTNGPRRLKDWVAAGGTLIGIGSATSFLADPRTGLLAISQENVPRPAIEPPKLGEATPPAAVAPAAPATPGGPASIAAPALVALSLHQSREFHIASGH